MQALGGRDGWEVAGNHSVGLRACCPSLCLLVQPQKAVVQGSEGGLQNCSFCRDELGHNHNRGSSKAALGQKGKSFVLFPSHHPCEIPWQRL